MENRIERPPVFKIEEAHPGDEVALAPMHVQAWKESYVGTESGLTSEMVDEMLSHITKDSSFRRNTIIESLSYPERVLYRVVKNNTNDIVGFLHGSKKEGYNELDAIYLLNEAKRSGVGGKLMETFLDWADENKPSRLSVFSFNDDALGFYSKYGFVKTHKPAELYKDKLPFIEMVRPAER